MRSLVSNLSFLLFLLPTFSAQQSLPPASTQLTSFNSTFKLSASQIARANFTSSEAASINSIINFERSQYAGSPSSQDPFYTLLPPSDLPSTSLIPGTPLKTDDPTTITPYALPPNTALSRILYTSLTLNDTPVPASAYILWPFAPRPFPSSPEKSPAAPVVLWTHMTSGFFPPASPSSHRSLFAGDSAPFALALAGYAVVAPDYAGLGVSRGFDNESLSHQYLAAPASANDAIYALRAAQAAFPERLSREFVVVGQSQGGGVAWGVAELLARNQSLAGGYLGAVAVSPTTKIFSGAANFIAPFVGFGLGSVFPSFRASEWLTDFGLGRAEVLREVQGGLATAFGFFTTEVEVARAGFDESWEARAYARSAEAGGKEVRGPLLVVQGTEDAFVPFEVTSGTVDETCKEVPGNRIEYLVSNGTGHVPTLFSTRSLWMRWVEERFEGKKAEERVCGHRTVPESFLPVGRYQKTWNSFAQWAGAAKYSYEVPLAL